MRAQFLSSLAVVLCQFGLGCCYGWRPSATWAKYFPGNCNVKFTVIQAGINTVADAARAHDNGVRQGGGVRHARGTTQGREL